MADVRSRSRSERRRPKVHFRKRSRSEPRQPVQSPRGRPPPSPPKVSWIATRGRKFSLLCVHADEIEQATLQQGKSLAGMLGMNCTVAETIVDFPHSLDGGCPAVDRDPDFFIYGQITVGKFAGVGAVCRGSNRHKREQGLGLAFILAACMDKPPGEIMGAEVDEDVMLLIDDSKRQFIQLKSEVATMRANTPQRQVPKTMARATVCSLEDVVDMLEEAVTAHNRLGLKLQSIRKHMGRLMTARTSRPSSDSAGA